MMSNIIIGFTLTNISIGIVLGFLIFKLGELIAEKIYKSSYMETKFDETILGKKNTEQSKIESFM